MIRSRINARIKILDARLRRDERGVAMTEFIILVPVFLTIFAATMHLTALQSSATRDYVLASAAMWNDAMGIQADDGTSDLTHTSPQAAGGQAGQWLSRNPGNLGGGLSPEVARWREGVGQGMLSEGAALLDTRAVTIDEEEVFSYDKAIQPSTRYIYGTDKPEVALGSTSDLNQIFHAAAEAPGNARGNATSSVLLKLFSDGADATTPVYANRYGRSPLASVANEIQNFGGSRLASATGARYGLAFGEAQNGPNKATFNARAAPHPMVSAAEAARAPAMSRISLDESPKYRTLLNLRPNAHDYAD